MLTLMSALPVGSSAPPFSFDDDRGRRRSLTDLRDTPVILSFAPSSNGTEQPVLQHLTFDGEPLTLLSSRDESLEHRYGVGNQSAVFVLAANNVIVWRYSGSDDPSTVPRAEGSGLN